MKLPRIPSDERADLVSYFSGAAFARLAASPMGPALERAQRFGESMDCPVCSGTGRIDGSPRSLMRAEKAAAKKRADVACGTVRLREKRIPKGCIPHLAKYRQLREAAAVSTQAGAYAAAERYRVEHARDIAAETTAEAEATGDAEIEILRAEIASARAVDRPVAETHWCPACNGARVVARACRRMEVSVDPGAIDVIAPGTGEGCSQASCLDALMHVHETRSACGVDLGESEIERLGRVGARLARFSSAVAEARWVLMPGGYAAELGDRSSKGADRGAADLLGALARLHGPGGGGAACLLSVVPAGRDLIARSQSGWSDDPTPEQVLDRVRERQRIAPEVSVGSALADARRQADALAVAAVRAWLASGSPKPRHAAPRPARPRLRAPRSPLAAELAGLLRESMGGQQ